MSDTDDTDVLLLIPPNFFLVQSSGSDDSLLESSRTVVHKPLSCTAQVIGKLVNQVQTLETRLESLEITSDRSSFGIKSKNKTLDSTDSFDNQSDRKCYTFPRRRRKKSFRSEVKRDLSLTSLDSISSYRKCIPPLKLKDSPKDTILNDRSMDGDISSIVSTPSKKNDKLLLNEIDEFLTKVETYESPESKYKSRDICISPENIIKAAGDYISHKLDSKLDESDQIKLPSGRIVSSNVLDKYIYLVKSNPTSAQGERREENPLPSTSYKNEANTTRLSESKHDIPNPIETKSPSIRRLNFTEKDVHPTSTPKKPTQTYTDSFRPTSNKIYDRATKVLEQYKAQSSRNTQSDTYLSMNREEFKMPQMRPYAHDNKDSAKIVLQNKLLESIDTDLLSLSELWGERGERERNERVDSVKLEEERLKREHCEAMIQQLQRKVLEQQEKIAVAIKVDKAKDAAIAKLKDAWLRLTGSLDKAEERHRSALDKMVREVENFRGVADEAQKKTSHFEAELYKALDLAHDYQEKCKQLVIDKKDYQEQTERLIATKQETIENRDKEIQGLKENYETVMRLNKQSTDCIKNLEEVLEKERTEHEESKRKSSELTRKIQSLHDETALLVQERDVLKEKVNEERARCSVLERQLCEKQNQTSELLRKCDTLDTDCKTLRKAIDIQKNELKTHYQKQLEDAVMSKLQEFQQQLDQAEKEMEVDTRNKEAAIVDTFNKQMIRIEEQHKLEVTVLEEKHREEIKLYRLQLAQANEKNGLLENKLDSYRRRRGELATQLHGVMEAQWRQALSILTSGHDARPDTASSTVCPGYSAPAPLSLPAARRLSRDKQFSFEQLDDNELQQYVKLLLTKPPSVEAAAPAPPPRDEPTSDRHDQYERHDRHDRHDQYERHDRHDRHDRRRNKPPWKA